MTTDHLDMPEDHMDELYHSNNPLVSFVHNNRLNNIKTLINKPNQKVLDAGCGEGHLIAKLKNKIPSNEYHGIDITKIALKKAKERCPYAKLSKQNLNKLNYKDETFDIIICTEVLEHIYEYKEVIEELKRTLKTGGTLILTFPNETLWTISRFLLRRKPIKVPDHVNSFTPNKIKVVTNLKPIKQINMPFHLPFIISLGSLIAFKK